MEHRIARDEFSFGRNTDYDTVKLGDFTVTDQPVHLAQRMSSNFDGFVDGILGLSFGVLSDTTTVLENMMAHKLIERGIVSFVLGKQSMSGGGEAPFGGVDTSKVASGHEIVYTEVINDQYWAVDIQNILVNGQGVAFDGNEAMLSVMDTGSTLLTLPSSAATAVHKNIPASIRFQRCGTFLARDLHRSRLRLRVADLMVHTRTWLGSPPLLPRCVSRLCKPALATLRSWAMCSSRTTTWLLTKNI